jgi:ABC-type glycerol-3-phosphate transport system substrate-binding protein
VIIPTAAYAVSASSGHKEAAWSFLSYMLSEDFTPRFTGGSGVQIGSKNVKEEILSMNRNVFERRAREEMKPLTERVGTLIINEVPATAPYLASFAYESLDELNMTLPKFQNYALTEEDIARVRDAIEAASTLSASDTTALNIINEELGAYYAGAKTAEETVRLIQSRVALYVGESK